MKQNKSKFKIFIRIGNLVLLSFVAILIFTLVYPVYDLLIEKIGYYLEKEFYSVVKYAVGVSLVVLLAWAIYQMGGIRIRDFYTFRLWLSIWKLAIITAVVWLFLANKFIVGHEYSITGLGWIILIVLALLPFINYPIVGILYLRSKFVSHRSMPDELTHRQKNMEDLENFNDPIGWLDEEKPIEKPAEDRFEMAVVARRVARILREKPLKTIGLIGPYGCGKSSILNMVEHYIKNPPPGNNKELFDQDKIIICKIDGWGLRKESSAEVILRKTVAELSKYVDCLGLRNIPQEYQKALSDAGPWWLKLVSIGLKKKDAVQQLEKLDNVLLCTGMRMIIFIEDVDRNIQKDEEISEVAALLDRLRGLENVSFVLAISSNVNMADAGISMRLSEHIEVIPELTPKFVRTIVGTFRKNCLAQYPDDIDCVSKDERDKQWVPESNRFFNLDVLHSQTGGHDRPVFAIPKLLTEPRLLKQSLRRTWQAWRNLHGEIDFDDLLMVNVLRFAAPKAFDFVHNYIHKLRAAKDGKLSADIEKAIRTALEGMNVEDKSHIDQNTFEVLWNNYVKDVSWNKKAAYNLIEALFPGITNWKTLGPQCIGRKSNSTDYWGRLNAEELNNNEIQDQQILHAINEWKQDKESKVHQDHTLAEAILRVEGFSEKIEHFGVMLTGSEVRYLAQQLFALILKGQGKRKHPSGSDDGYPGFIELWRLAYEKSIENYDEWLLQEIQKALSVSLRFANELYYYWGSEKLIKDIAKLRSKTISKSRDIYRNVESLLEAIDPYFIYCVYHFAVLYSEPKYGGSGYKPEDWTWLADILLEASRKNAQIIVPQIVPLVCQGNMGKKEYIYEFNNENTNKLFGEKVSELMRLLSKEIDVSLLSEENRNIIQFAQDEAKTWLSQQA